MNAFVALQAILGGERDSGATVKVAAQRAQQVELLQ